MDQRREPRFEADGPVAVTVLGPHPVCQTARVKNASGRGLGLVVDNPITLGSALKIELDDSVILGEVAFCQGVGSSYLVGVDLDQMICGLAGLGRSLQQFSEGERCHAVDDRKP
jgi:PilZ domain